MACANPQFLQYKYQLTRNVYTVKPIQIPCGYCLNCRKDKQNYIIDRANYEYKKRLTAAFVSFTYDDIYLLDRCAVGDFNGAPIFDDIKGETVLRASLNYSDFTHFIDRVKKYVSRHTEIQGVLCQPDFAYLYCGEYGDDYGRPHFHCLFFGLDFAFCEKIFRDSWNYGLIDVLPLLDGGIRYVTKYLDKQVFGYQAEELYDLRGLARPRLRMSKGFGKGLLLDNISEIKENNFTYEIHRHLRRPISAYWKKLLIGNNPLKDTTRRLSFKKEVLNKIDFELSNYHKKLSKDFLTARREARAYSLSKAKMREKELEIYIRNSGHPVEEVENIVFSKFGYPSYDHKKILNLPVDIKRLVSEAYVFCLYSDVVPF